MARRKKPEPLSVQQVIAAAIRRERLSREWNQEQLADSMREVGFPWTRMTVTEVERSDPDNEKAEKKGGRQVTIAELFGLGAVYGVSIAELLWTGRTVTFSEELSVGDQRGLVGSLVDPEQIYGAFAPVLEPVIAAQIGRLTANYVRRVKKAADELRSTAGYIEEMVVADLMPKEEA